MDSAIKKAAEKIDYLVSDEDAIRQYQRHEMALFDQKSYIAQREKEIAIKLLKKGATVDFVVEVTDLLPTTIKKLQNELTALKENRKGD